MDKDETEIQESMESGAKVEAVSRVNQDRGGNMKRKVFKLTEPRPLLINQVTRPAVKCCLNNCRTNLEKETDEEREAMKGRFKASKQIETKNHLLQHLQAQHNLGLDTEKFNGNGAFYCNSTFSQAVGVSTYILGEALAGQKEQVQCFVHGNNHMIKFSVKTSKFKAWFKTFLEKYSQSDPEKKVQVIAAWLKKVQMYEMFKAETTSPYLRLQGCIYFQNSSNFFHLQIPIF